MPPLPPNVTKAGLLRSKSGWNNSSLSRRSNTTRGLLSTRTPHSSGNSGGGVPNPSFGIGVVREAFPRGATGTWQPVSLSDSSATLEGRIAYTWNGARWIDDGGPGIVQDTDAFLANLATITGIVQDNTGVVWGVGRRGSGSNYLAVYQWISNVWTLVNSPNKIIGDNNVYIATYNNDTWLTGMQPDGEVFAYQWNSGTSQWDDRSTGLTNFEPFFSLAIGPEGIWVVGDY